MYSIERRMLIVQLGVPVKVVLATDHDSYRKPSTQMWQYFIEHLNEDVQPDAEHSFYCGDEAGRLPDWQLGMKKDFSSNDRLFAQRIGVRFETPDTLFGGREPTEHWRWDDPTPTADGLQIIEHPETPDHSSITAAADETDECLHTHPNPADVARPEQNRKQEVVLLVGYPGSGKSTYAQRHLIPKGYVHVSMDKQRTRSKCVALCSELEKQLCLELNKHPSLSTGHNAQNATFPSLFSDTHLSRSLTPHTAHDSTTTAAVHNLRRRTQDRHSSRHFVGAFCTQRVGIAYRNAHVHMWDVCQVSDLIDNTQGQQRLYVLHVYWRM